MNKKWHNRYYIILAIVIAVIFVISIRPNNSYKNDTNNSYQSQEDKSQEDKSKQIDNGVKEKTRSNASITFDDDEKADKNISKKLEQFFMTELQGFKSCSALAHAEYDKNGNIIKIDESKAAVVDIYINSDKANVITKEDAKSYYTNFERINTKCNIELHIVTMVFLNNDNKEIFRIDGPDDDDPTYYLTITDPTTAKYSTEEY